MTVRVMLTVFQLGVQCCIAHAAPGSPIPEEYANNITVYHLNPANADTVPIDMNTGDAEGDLNFYLDQFLLPMECADPNADTFGKFDCNNPERVGDLVVTKVEMEVDARFTNYSTCNLCDTGVDPISRQPCEVGSYVCDCGYHKTCDPSLVGVEVREPHFPPSECSVALLRACGAVQDDPASCAACSQAHFAELKAAQCGDGVIDSFCPALDSCALALESLCAEQRENATGCPECRREHAAELLAAGCRDLDGQAWCPSSACSPSPGDEWKCWRSNVVQKAGGNWYSHPAAGLCQEGSAPGSCSWRVLSTSTVREACLRDSVADAVEAADGVGCFEACGTRNETSPCWIGCFFDTLLGREARRNSSRGAVTGMPLADVIAGWTRPFLQESNGGCPKIDAFRDLVV